MDENKLQAIYERVQKLFALANSANENEASAATQKAHELLIKYNLDLQKLQERPPSMYDRRAADKRTFRRTEDDFVDRILTDHFFVLVYTQRQKGPLYGKNSSVSSWYETVTTVEGTRENVEVALYVRLFLVAKFYQLWLNAKRTLLYEAREQRSYYAGLERGLKDKLSAQRKRVETEYALVLVKDAYLEERSESMVSRRGRDVDFSDSYHHGKKDGREIQIRRGLTGEKTESGKLLGPGKKKE